MPIVRDHAFFASREDAELAQIEAAVEAVEEAGWFEKPKARAKGEADGADAGDS